MSSDKHPVANKAQTVVPSGIEDPVERARAELQAALAAIELKANLPRRAGEAMGRGIERVRGVAEEAPGVVVAGVVVVAATVGGAVWAIARAVAR